MTISVWYLAYAVVVLGIAYFFVDKYKKQSVSSQSKAAENQREYSLTLQDLNDKLNIMGNTRNDFKREIDKLNLELNKQTQALLDANEQNANLTALVEQLNNSTVEADGKTISVREELNRLTETFKDFRKQLRKNTDLELSTTDQIIDELQKRKSGKFLMLIPEVTNSPDGEMVSVSVKTIMCGLKKNQILFLLKSTLQSIGPSGGFDDGTPEWGQNPYGNTDDDDEDDED
jgi:hypothetical protein